MAGLHLGVFGGTFDPIHYGHLSAAAGAIHLAGLDGVLFVPAGQNPLKDARPTPAEHRLAMVRLAVEGNPAFRVSTLELERQPPHYTVDTLDLLQACHPGAHLYFIAGTDALLQVESWHDYRRLLTVWTCLAVTRPGASLVEWEGLRARLGPLERGLRLLSIPGVAISGRDLRERAARGYPLTYLVPPAVEAYINQHNLY